ncbi:DUF6114 domain-containing protein [Streptomyces odontomachi]|uniref:DUF6114 domain-containing protein n=1 Tax=Streptomyces odontomachi TaxID=2944940 RepID=UPI00210B938F|nr:DUF6114 domain-containing protein [Streptomyces sp. ODS25]
MSAEAQAGLGDRLGRMRQSFREWRWERPYWGGLLTLLGGIPIMYLPYANLTLGTMTIRMATTAGAGSLIIGVLLVVLGLTMWFQKHSRVFAGVAAILLALVSLVVSNFGGFLFGFLLALIGGGLAISWAPGKPQAEAAQDEPSAEDPDDDEAPSPAVVRGVAGATYSVSGGGSSSSSEPTTDLFGNEGTSGRHRAR